MQVTIKRKYAVPDGRVQYKCVGNLYDYLTQLKQEYSDFSVQRRIVKNTYLDSIYDTIKRLEPIPTITLSATEEFEAEEGNTVELDIPKCEILDGLQRTFRLKTILLMKSIIEENGFTDYRTLRKWLNQNEDVDDYLGTIEFVNTKFLKSLFTDGGIDAILDAYHKYEVELTVWVGLSEKETIRQMMLLNAGQRPVSSTHQYELVFMYYFTKGDVKVEGVKLYRERDKEYYELKRGKREVGEYSLASVVIALQSFILKKPLRITPANRLQIDASDYLDQPLIDYYFNHEFLNYFLKIVYELDCSSQDSAWRQWFGKDTTLSGIFAALGYVSENNDDERKVLESFLERVQKKKIDYRLRDFDRAYNDLSSVNVNVGNAVRKSIYQYTLALLNGNNSYNWSDCFPKNKYADETW